MASYTAQIRIGVSGQQDLKNLENQINFLSGQINKINASNLKINGSSQTSQTLNNYNKALKESASNLQQVQFATAEETQAIQAYVSALGVANTASARQNKLIQDEINLRGEQARKTRLKAKGIIENVSAYETPAGPKAPTAGQTRRAVTGSEEYIAARRAADTEERIQAVLRRKQETAQKKQANAQRGESIALGVGFPLMFGAGPGSVAGSLAGSFVGSGFGGQILGGALGQMIDDAVVSVRDLGNALSSVGDNYSVLRETGLQFTAELEKQVRAAKQLGDYTKAAQLQRGALAATGDIGASSGSKTSATEGVAASVNRLDVAFKEVVKTVSLLLGMIGAPTIEIISIILKGVNAILVVVNSIITGVGGLVAMIPGFADEIKRSNEEALKTTAEYQNQLAEQDKLIEQAIRLNAASAKLNTLALKNVGLLGAEKQAADLTLRSKEKQAALEEEILKIKEAVPSGATAEQQAKAAQLEAQARIKFNGEVFKDQIALYGSLYDQITADNINIARQKEDQEKNYRDMVRDTARLQADLNLDIARKAQDLRVQNIEKENELIKRQADLRISGLELESKKRLSGMAEFTLEGDPEEQKIKIGVAEAIDTLKIGLAKIDAEAADRQRKLKTNLMRLDIENERYKYDMALRINRLNVDNVNKIAVINTQINRQNQDASRQRYTEGLNLLKYQAQHIRFTSSRDKREMEQEVPRRTGTDLEYVKQSITNLDTVIKAFDDLEKRIEILLTKAPGALSTVSQLPTVSGDTSAVVRESDRLKQLTIGADQVSTQETQGKQAQAVYEQNTKLLALSFQGTGAIKNQYDNTKKLLDTEKQRQLLIQTGINPQLMEQQITNEKLYDTAKAGLENSKKYIEANRSLIPDAESLLGLINTRLITLERINAVLKSDTVELEKQKKITEMTTVLEQGKRQIAGVEAGMRSGFIGQAQSTYADKITQGFTPEQATAMAAQTQALELATTKARALEGAYNDIGSAMASTLTDGVAGLVAGTTTAEQVFVDFLKNIGDALIKAAQQMIAQYLAIAAAQALANMFSPAAGASGASAGFGMPEIASGFGLGPQRMFADGGRPPVGVPSLVGEKGPELFVPSTAGTIIPNHNLGIAAASGGGGNTSVVVNVDATGSKVEGDMQGGKQLGTLLAAAVQKELIKQKRPGGILA